MPLHRGLIWNQVGEQSYASINIANLPKLGQICETAVNLTHSSEHP